MDFVRYFYEGSDGEYLGAVGEYVGELCPFDATSAHQDWKTGRYLAIDQGTMGSMIEIHITQLFWNLFMGAPETKQGLQHLGFVSSAHDLSSTCDATTCPGP
jgi:hypothetical protein